MRPGLQERIESHPLGRAAISVVVAFVLGAFVVSTLPDSELRRRVAELVAPAARGVPLSHSWALFAPAPRRTTIEVRARLTYPDASTETWTMPDGGRLLAPYRVYRWRKWADYVQSDAHLPLRRPFAEWLVRTQFRQGQHPVWVVLIRRFQDIAAPGAEPGGRGPWREEEYYTFEPPPPAPDPESGR